jgi:hypothetical protein
MPLLSWKKDVIAIGYDLFIDENLVGEIRNEQFSNNSYVKIKEKKYFFEASGIGSKKLIVIDMVQRNEIGHIKFNALRSKAAITLFDKEYVWKPNNMLHSKWSIYSTTKEPILEGKAYKSDSSFFQDEIDMLLNFCGIITLLRLRLSV